MKTLEESQASSQPFKVWWHSLSHAKKRVLIGYECITTVVFDDLPQRIQLAIFGHWDYWYKS